MPTKFPIPLVNEHSKCASAPGKVILFGEHAVVYGEVAIAAALSDLRIHVLVTPTPNTQSIDIYMPDLPSPVEYSFESSRLVGLEPLEAPPTVDTTKTLQKFLVNAELDELGKTAVLPLLYLLSQLVSSEILRQGLQIWIQSRDLPVGAGLGSSAAFSVASAAALLQLGQPTITNSTITINETNVPNDEIRRRIDQYAYYSEILLHGTPSGIDNAVSCYGQAILFQKDTERHTVTKQPLEIDPPLDMILVFTHVPRSTKQLVAHVREVCQQFPFGRHVLSAMGAIAKEFGSTQWVPERLLTLIRANHNLLRTMGVSHPSLDRIVDIVDKVAPGVAAAKLTGAGGGGCAFVALTDVGAKARIVRALARDPEWKFSCFQSSVGGQGVLLEDPHSFVTKKQRFSKWTSRSEWVTTLLGVSILTLGAVTLIRKRN